MTHLVNDLLEVSRITRGKVTLYRQRLDAAAVINRAVETSRPALEARGHALHLEYPVEPTFLDGDLTRLAQVLGNLLDNAAKYTPDRGHVYLSGRREGSDVVFRVRDTGIGIPGEMLSKIFDMFVQVDQTLDRSQGGLGIGLTLVRSLAQLHGGSVSVRSEGPGHGSEFIVRLPAVSEAAPPVPASGPGGSRFAGDWAANPGGRR